MPAPAAQRLTAWLKSNAEYGSLEGFAPAPNTNTLESDHVIPAGGIRRWKAVKWTVEYRSPLAGEDMPRKPLDSLEAANAPGIAGGCRPKAVKHPRGCPAASDALIAALPTTGGQCRSAPGRRQTPARQGAPGGVRRKARRRRPPARRLPAGLTGFCAHHPAPLGLGW